MANYKSIIDVESVAQATEEMNVLVEDSGSLKKVPAGGMIGGGGNMCVITISNSETATYAVPVTYTYTASMGYSELLAGLGSGEVSGVMVANTVDSFYAPAITIDCSNSDYMVVYYITPGINGTLYYYSDNTITNQAPK